MNQGWAVALPLGVLDQVNRGCLDSQVFRSVQSKTRVRTSDDNSFVFEALGGCGWDGRELPQGELPKVRKHCR